MHRANVRWDRISAVQKFFDWTVQTLGTEFTDQEDCKSFALLLDVMLSRTQFSAKSPITMENIATVLELARKYDTGLAVDCDYFLRQQTLDWQDSEQVGEIFALAAIYELQVTLAQCRQYVTANYKRLLLYDSNLSSTRILGICIKREC